MNNVDLRSCGIISLILGVKVDTYQSSIGFQQIAIKEWNKQINNRFSNSELSSNITEIKLRTKRK